MMLLRLGVCAILLALPTTATAEAHVNAHASLDVHVLSVVPFVGLLLAIALLPILRPRFWHSNLRRGLVAAAFAFPVVAYLYYLETTGQPGMSTLQHHVQEYTSFIILLFALYTISGGIVVEGSFPPTPLVNASFLSTGAVLANLIGTTGASMVLIRPVLRINQWRKHSSHIPLFFIFMVSNFGGLLTPLGDPPLFLGFLHGVDFSWTLKLWPQWLLANGVLLVLFLIWDALAYCRETKDALRQSGPVVPFRVRGVINFLFLAGVLLAVLLQSKAVSEPLSRLAGPAGPNLQLRYPAAEIAMLTMAILSVLTTPRELRRQNSFSWEAIVEVAVLFAGIFVTMAPALSLLAAHAGRFGLHEGWQYFWLTGMLSSFLDNAPTYLTFGTIAVRGDNFAPLMSHPARLLEAISCGAVFFGAMTYIGNGPNFMVKAIAESSGYKTPSFFGYLIYACAILLPILVMVTYLFFRP